VVQELQEASAHAATMDQLGELAASFQQLAGKIVDFPFDTATGEKQFMRVLSHKLPTRLRPHWMPSLGSF
jgi:hypothetical protein